MRTSPQVLSVLAPWTRQVKLTFKGCSGPKNLTQPHFIASPDMREQHGLALPAPEALRETCILSGLFSTSRWSAHFWLMVKRKEPIPVLCGRLEDTSRIPQSLSRAL